LQIFPRESKHKDMMATLVPITKEDIEKPFANVSFNKRLLKPSLGGQRVNVRTQ
jgi:hypothetical protein